MPASRAEPAGAGVRSRDASRLDGRRSERSELGALASHPASGRAARIPLAVPQRPLLHRSYRDEPAGQPGVFSQLRHGGRGNVIPALRSDGHAGHVPQTRRRRADGGADRPALGRTLRDGSGRGLESAGARRLRARLPIDSRALRTTRRSNPPDAGAVESGTLALQGPLLLARRRRLPTDSRSGASADPDRRRRREAHHSHGGEVCRRVELRLVDA